MPKVSIIVPVYNVKPYLEKCITSILIQSYQDFELILVDDGSTDGCSKMCDIYAEQNNKIKVIHKINGGLSSARNAGIEVAQGKYLSFIDSDDYIAEDMIELLVNQLEKEKADISICGIFHCYSGKNPEKSKPWYRVLNSEEAIEIAFEGKIFSVNAVNKLYKKEIFNSIRYPEGKATEDAFVIVDVFSRANRIVATSEQKYFYFHREGSITTVKTASNCFDCIEAYERNYKIIKNKYPNIEYIAKSNLCWSYFYALDRLLRAEDEKKYIDMEKNIIRFIRRNIVFILFKSKVANTRKISALGLMIHRNIYKMLLNVSDKWSYRQN